MAGATEIERADTVLEFWLADGVQNGWPSRPMGDRWFGGDAALDREIEQRFGPLVREALAGGLADWEAGPLPRLALVILLDQFTRNVFRGGARAFAGDPRAQQLVLDALEQDFDGRLPWVGRVFLYMPLMHAEDIELQRRCVHCFEALLAAAPASRQSDLQGNLRFARSHLDIIERFGRFPYRNQALGRESTEAEREFLEHGPRFGQ